MPSLLLMLLLLLLIATQDLKAGQISRPSCLHYAVVAQSSVMLLLLLIATQDLKASQFILITIVSLCLCICFA